MAKKWNNPVNTSIGGRKVVPAYQHWHHMRHRCQEPYWLKFPTYIGTSYQPSWEDYDIFYDWVTNQKGYGIKGANLDKDLLGDGTYYSEETCCLLPSQVNMSLTAGNQILDRVYPVGVSFNGGKYMVPLAYNGKNKNLGRYDTADAAFNVYKKAKIERIKELAFLYKDRINYRAFDALMTYDRISKGIL